MGDIDSSTPSFREAQKRLTSAVEEHGVLLTDPAKFVFRGFDGEEEPIFEQLLLEVTDTCNLRCEYCIYSEKHGPKSRWRQHGRTEMKWETAKASLEMLRGLTKEGSVPRIDYYGGEPLLSFDLIKSIVDYSEKLFGKHGVTHSITTNGTLIDEAIADYLIEHNFHVMVSIDGPEKIHDVYRRFPSGMGSFQQAIHGLELVATRYETLCVRKRLMISSVYAPPFWPGKFQEIQSLWETYPWFKNIGARITYPSYGDDHPHNKTMNYPEEKEKLSQIFDEGLIDMGSEFGFNSIFQQEKEFITNFINRQTTDSPDYLIPVAAPCWPGRKKRYVKVDGAIAICEQMHIDDPIIGDSQKGIDQHQLQKSYEVPWVNLRNTKCRYCWALRFCKVCFKDFLVNGIFVSKNFDERCKFEQNDIEGRLQNCIEILEGGEYLLRSIFHDAMMTGDS